MASTLKLFFRNKLTVVFAVVAVLLLSLAAQQKQTQRVIGSFVRKAAVLVLEDEALPVATTNSTGSPEIKANTTKRAVPHKVMMTTTAEEVGKKKVRQDKLEFVHITKTGGSAIEKAAATQAGIAWGACHYRNGAFKAMGCPDPPDLQGRIRMKRRPVHPYRGAMALWHVPLQYVNPHPFPPEEGFKTFAVVRNPYDRAASLFYCIWMGYTGNLTGINNYTELFNEWIQEKAKQQYNIKLTPQSEYVFDIHDKNYTNTSTRELTRMVDHVVYFEELPESFNALMAKYQLNISLPKEKFNAGRPSSKHNRLTSFNFTSTTIQVLNDIFQHDFDNFGYERMTF